MVRRSTRDPVQPAGKGLQQMLLLLVLACVFSLAEDVTGEGTDGGGRYVADATRVVERVTAPSVPSTSEPPDWAATVQLVCPAVSAAQSGLHPEVNSYPLPSLGSVVVRVQDDIFANPVVLACFYGGTTAAAPASCFGQGECSWSGSTADRVEVWVPAATLYEGSIVKGSMGDVFLEG